MEEVLIRAPWGTEFEQMSESTAAGCSKLRRALFGRPTSEVTVGANVASRPVVLLGKC